MMEMYVVQLDGASMDGGETPTPAELPEEIPHLQLGEGTYLIDGEQARDALLRFGQVGSPRVQIRTAGFQDLPGVHAYHPTTDEIAMFVQTARRRRGHPEQQPVATDRTSVLTALNDLLNGH
jgi:hypothetical protein